MSFKIGDRVRVINEVFFSFNFVGRIINIDTYKMVTVFFNDGQRGTFNSLDLKLVPASWETLLVGDIILDGDEEAEVLEVGVNTFLISYFGNKKKAGDWHTFSKAKDYGWTIKGQEDEEVKEMTVAEVSEKLGYPVKIVK